MNATTVLSNAGRSFLRAFAAAILVFAPGISAAPNLDQARALGIAALVASLAAGLRALQDFVPALQVPGPFGDYIGSFLRAFAAQLLVLTIGILTAPELSFGSAVVVGAITGAITAGLVAVQKFTAGTPVTPPA